MDQPFPDKMGTRGFNKPIGGFVVVLVVAVFIGGWLYVDAVRNELDMKIQALSAQVAASKAGALQKSGAAAANGTDPLSYPSDPSKYTVEQKAFTVRTWLNSADLTKSSAECAVNNPASYYDTLLSKIYDRDGYAYSFNYNGPQQGERTFVVRVVPNPGYQELADFLKDFKACTAAADQPSFMNNDWLVFTAACDEVQEDDGTGRPFGCDEVRKAVGNALKLK